MNKCVTSLRCPPCMLLRNTDIQAKNVEVKRAHLRFTELSAVPRKWISCGFAREKRPISKPDRAEKRRRESGNIFIRLKKTSGLFVLMIIRCDIKRKMTNNSSAVYKNFCCLIKHNLTLAHILPTYSLQGFKAVKIHSNIYQQLNKPGKCRRQSRRTRELHMLHCCISNFQVCT